MKYYVCDRCRHEIGRGDLHYALHMRELAWDDGQGQTHYDLCDNCWQAVAAMLAEPVSHN